MQGGESGGPASAAEVGDATHGPLAMWARHGDRERGSNGLRTYPRVEQGADRSEALLRGRVEPSIGAHAAKA